MIAYAWNNLQADVKNNYDELLLCNCSRFFSWLNLRFTAEFWKAIGRTTSFQLKLYIYIVASSTSIFNVVVFFWDLLQVFCTLLRDMNKESLIEWNLFFPQRSQQWDFNHFRLIELWASCRNVQLRIVWHTYFAIYSIVVNSMSVHRGRYVIRMSS